MKILLLTLILIPALIAVMILIGMAIERLASRPEDSKLRQAVDQTCRSNGLHSPRARLITALVLLGVSALLFLLMSRDSSWAGQGGSWL